MQIFSSWSERQAQLVRWLLLSGWIFLIVSLFAGIDLYPFDVNRCGGSPDCHSLEGNQIFWGMVVPGSLFVLVVFSHELWRRICPLALVSQLFRMLGWQRRVRGKGGRLEVAKVASGSWLGRHHLELQWSLLIAGLCLRLLVVNSNTFGLALLLSLTALAALVVGWAYGGKAWCQYVCPMAPVQTILTGPRSVFGSPAHVQTNTRVTQSMCRTVTDTGQVRSACVACQSPCIDIDAERAYWATLKGKRGLNWAWGSYPGLVLAFFLIIKLESRGGLDYLRSGMWAYDNEAADYAWSPLATGPWIPAVPRLVAVPLLLVLAAWISVALQRWLQQWQLRQLTPQLGERAEAIAIHRTRLLASFGAVNIFFWFADPTIGLLGPAGGQVVRSLVLIVSGMWLQRGWRRERGTYGRESTSASLRRQLEQLIPDLSPYLDGRSIEELSAAEVFTLAQVLPAQIIQTKRNLYKGVMADLFASGRLEQATALVQLEELRQSLQLDDEDHWTSIQELAQQDQRILDLTGQQRPIQHLRQEAAGEALRELLRLTRASDLQQLLEDPHVHANVSRIRRDFLLDEARWQELVGSFGTSGRQAA